MTNELHDEHVKEWERHQAEIRPEVVLIQKPITVRQNFPIPTETQDVLDYLDYCIGVTTAQGGNKCIAYLLIEAAETIANHADGALSRTAA